jgi:hypothetical protein
MPRDDTERRRASRRVPQRDETLARVRLRTGRELGVVNISTCGVLVEGSTRLLPGTHADVHVVTRHGRTLVRSRVIRSLVWRLDAEAVCYRTALAFDTAVDTDSGPAPSERRESNGYPVPTKSPVIEGGAGNGYPNSEDASQA